MVYGGRLSKACEPCRTRRAKCDLLYPECGQCLRAKRKCHGYRDTEGLRINDMSDTVIKKFRTRNRVPQPKVLNRLVEANQPDAELLSPDFNYKDILRLSSSLIIPIEDRAVSYFRATFVIGQSRSFQYLEECYQGPMSIHLTLCIQAVGLASLSRATRSTKLENHARRVYGSALKSINAALQCPDLVRKDGTMSAVMLLDQFERLVPPISRSTEAWTNHLNGAAGLMKLRGADQFKTKMGLEIFVQMSSHMFVTCMEHEIPLPEDFLALRRFAENFVDTSDVIWRLTNITIPYIAFRAAVKSGSIKDSSQIISDAAKIDAEMAILLDDLPAWWIPQRIGINEKSQLVYEDHYDLYLDYRIAEGLNSIRGGRIALFDIIIDEAARITDTLEDYFTNCSLSSDTTTYVQLARKNLIETTSLICACVPQLAGYLTHLDSESSNPAFSTSILDLKIDASNTASVYALLWPLFAVANSQHTEPSAKKWIITQLRLIGRLYDIEKAIELAEILDSGVKMDIWRVYAMVGSICYSA